METKRCRSALAILLVMATALLCARAGDGAASALKDYQMCAMTESAQGLRVGVVHVPTKRSFMMRVGQVRNGLELVSANYDNETAVFRKDGQTKTLRMGERTVSGQARPAAAGASPKPDAGEKPAVAKTRVERKDALAKARNARASARAKALAARYAGLKEAGLVDAYHQEYQKSAIRSGAPPLPVALTPESDAELVNEGVLPAQETEPSEKD